MSAAVESATSQITSPVTGVRFSRYLPSTGAMKAPPMKLPYRSATAIGLSGEPGAG